MNSRADISSRLKIFPNGLPVLVLTIIALSLAISVVTRDPHWLNRGGALVAACAAGAVYLQIKSEIVIEKKGRRLESETVLQGGTEEFSPGVIGNMGRKLNQRRIEQEVEQQNFELTRERLKIVKIVVVCAFFGELLHGFGDLLLTVPFSHYFGH